jgi:hypothetical protein
MLRTIHDTSRYGGEPHQDAPSPGVPQAARKRCRQLAACIFRRVRSIAIDSTISTGVLLNLRERRHEFSHSLGQKASLATGEWISQCRPAIRKDS